MSLNVAGILEESARIYPEKPALLFDGGPRVSRATPFGAAALEGPSPLNAHVRAGPVGS